MQKVKIKIYRPALHMRNKRSFEILEFVSIEFTRICGLCYARNLFGKVKVKDRVNLSIILDRFRYILMKEIDFDDTLCITISWFRLEFRPLRNNIDIPYVRKFFKYRNKSRQGNIWFLYPDTCFRRTTNNNVRHSVLLFEKKQNEQVKYSVCTIPQK